MVGLVRMTLFVNCIIIAHIIFAFTLIIHHHNIAFVTT